MPRYALPREYRSIAGLLGLGALLAAPAVADENVLQQLESSLPRHAQECTVERTGALVQSGARLDAWAAELAWRLSGEDAAQRQATLRQLFAAKRRVDRALDRVLALRTGLVDLTDDTARRAAICQFLQAATHLTDLSGRLRYTVRDAVENASYAWEGEPQGIGPLLALLAQEQSAVGAVAMSYVLFDPPPDSAARPFSPGLKRQTLELMAAVRSPDLVPELAAYVREPNQPPELTLAAAESLVLAGLPQDPRPGDNAAGPPATTAAELAGMVAVLPADRWEAEARARRDALLSTLRRRAAAGLPAPRLQLGSFEVQPGDWLLMRNPSPYNRFTDLSPGLFTHVGVVAEERGADGQLRLVIVDLPERGDRVPATNVEQFLERTLDYVFLRHRDADVARRMGVTATSVIGNETVFDLTFRTDRVAAWKGQPLKSRRLHTYCAGFLLAVAQETGRPREEFFPLVEYPAGGQTRANLAVLGLSFGDNFLSPTGALFSAQFDLVGRREPMYDPSREIKEAIYDHFAVRMRDKPLTPSPNVQQSFVQQMAALARTNPWLARALARANAVSEHLDLEAAAKTAAVVQTLDEIAEDNMRDFDRALAVIRIPPGEELPPLASPPFDPQTYRTRHAALLRQWSAADLSPRQLRVALVQYYVARGAQQVDKRFFP